jgi:acyl carrier protein
MFAFFGRDGTGRTAGRSQQPGVQTGEYLDIEEIERRLERSPVIKEVCVFAVPGEAERSHELFAAIVPEMTALRRLRIANVRDYLRNEIDTLCASLPPHKRLVDFAVRMEDLPRTVDRKIDRLSVRHGGPAPMRLDADAAWTTSSVARNVLEILRAHAPTAPPHIHPGDRLDVDLKLDSLARIDLVIALETAFGTKLPDGTAAQCDTVADLVDAVLAIPDREHRADETRRAGGLTEILADGLAKRRADAAAGVGPGVGLGILRDGVLKAVRMTARLVLGLQVRGLDNVSLHRSFILCANHQSYLDAVLLFSALPSAVVRRTASLGKSRVFSRPGLRWLARRYDVAMVDADSNLVSAMQFSARALHDGKVVLVFPEGERTLDGDIRPLRRGAAVLATAMQVPIIPVVIDGPYRIWPRGRGFQRLARVSVAFLPPVYPPAEQVGRDRASFAQETFRLTAELQSRLEEALRALRSGP